jgi:hypothetical protein
MIIPSITEETRYCLGKHPEQCPHYVNAKAEGRKNHLVTRSRADVNPS